MLGHLKKQFSGFLCSEEHLLHLKNGQTVTTYIKVPCLGQTVAIYKGYGGEYDHIPQLLCPVEEDAVLRFAGLYNTATGKLYNAFDLRNTFGFAETSEEKLREEYEQQITVALEGYLLEHAASFCSGTSEIYHAQRLAQSAYIWGSEMISFTLPHNCSLSSPTSQMLSEYFDNPQAAVASQVVQTAAAEKDLLCDVVATWKEAQRLLEQYRESPEEWMAVQAEIVKATKGCVNVRISLRSAGRSEEFVIAANDLRKAELVVLRPCLFKGKEKKRYNETFGGNATFTARDIEYIRHGARYIYRAAKTQKGE